MIAELTEQNSYTRFEFQNFQKVHVIVFYSGRYQPSVEYVDIVQKLEYVIQPTSKFAYIDVDNYPSSVQSFNVTELPSVVIRSNPDLIDTTILSISPSGLFASLSKYEDEFRIKFPIEQERQFTRIRTVIASHPMQFFIKGTPEAPKCKFTRQLLAELRPLNIRFGFYDIDNDQPMRHWLKLFSGWKTFPQIFIKGELFGGLDVFNASLCVQLLVASLKDGSFLNKIPEESKVQQINSLPKLQQLHPRLILRAGSPDQQCQIAKILQEQSQDFQFYNTQLDEVLINQLRARNLDQQDLLLINNQLYTVEQVSSLKI